MATAEAVGLVREVRDERGDGRPHILLVPVTTSVRLDPERHDRLRTVAFHTDPISIAPLTPGYAKIRTSCQ